LSAEAVDGATAAPGYYGKLAARGDFVTRRLRRAFTAAWDEWLQTALLESRAALAERWLDYYLTSPLWRFALAAGACGPSTVAGVLMPSMDKVGRYFPLMIGRELESCIELGDLIVRADAWYEALETLALATLQPESPLETLDLPLAPGLPQTAASTSVQDVAPSARWQHIALHAVSLADLWTMHAARTAQQTVWWSSGSPHIAPCLLICSGMPVGAAFTAMLDGAWQEHGWAVIAPAPGGL
jgi:type VI secretion system protein ImpM